MKLSSAKLHITRLSNYRFRGMGISGNSVSSAPGNTAGLTQRGVSHIPPDGWYMRRKGRG
jgi:hypothetical protein